MDLKSNNSFKSNRSCYYSQVPSKSILMVQFLNMLATAHGTKEELFISLEYKPAAVIIEILQIHILIITSISITHLAMTFCYHMLPYSLQALKRMASIIAVQTHKIPFDLMEEKKRGYFVKQTLKTRF